MKNRDKEQERIDFTKRFKKALALRGHDEKSLAELKEIFDVSRTLIHEWRTGNKVPSNYSAGIIADKLNVDYQWLLTGKGVMKDSRYKTPIEAVLVEQLRNLTTAGQAKLISYAFDDCKVNEKDATSKEDKQVALKLVKKK